MAELGTLLGGILAELARARMIADQLTRELAQEYGADPVLSSLSVPRITMSEINLTLRFAVEDVDEVPPAAPSPEALRDDWRNSLPEKLTEAVSRDIEVTPEERKVLVETFSKTSRTAVPAGALKEATTGKSDRLATATTKPAVDSWSELPPSLRRKIGSKTTFNKMVSSTTRADLQKYLQRQQSKAFVEAALASRVKVAVKKDELPDTPLKQQEIQLSLRGEDLEILLDQDQGQEED